MVGGSIRVLQLLPPLKLVAMILLKVALKHQKSNQCTYQPVLYGSVWVELFNASCLLVYEQAVVQSRCVHPSSPFPFCKFHCRECVSLIIEVGGKLNIKSNSPRTFSNPWDEKFLFTRSQVRSSVDLNLKYHIIHESKSLINLVLGKLYLETICINYVQVDIFFSSKIFFFIILSTTLRWTVHRELKGIFQICNELYRLVDLWYLTPLSTIFQLQPVLLVQETEYPEKTIYMLQITDKLDHIMLFHIHLALEGVRPYNAMIGTDCISRCKSNYHKTMTAPALYIHVY